MMVPKTPSENRATVICPNSDCKIRIVLNDEDNREDEFIHCMVCSEENILNPFYKEYKGRR